MRVVVVSRGIVVDQSSFLDRGETMERVVPTISNNKLAPVGTKRECAFASSTSLEATVFVECGLQ